jgi:hypothetical protein
VALQHLSINRRAPRITVSFCFARAMSISSTSCSHPLSAESATVANQSRDAPAQCDHSVANAIVQIAAFGVLKALVSQRAGSSLDSAAGRAAIPSAEA